MGWDFLDLPAEELSTKMTTQEVGVGVEGERRNAQKVRMKPEEHRLLGSLFYRLSLGIAALIVLLHTTRRAMTTVNMLIGLLISLFINLPTSRFNTLLIILLITLPISMSTSLPIRLLINLFIITMVIILFHRKSRLMDPTITMDMKTVTVRVIERWVALTP